MIKSVEQQLQQAREDWPDVPQMMEPLRELLESTHAEYQRLIKAILVTTQRLYGIRHVNLTRDALARADQYQLTSESRDEFTHVALADVAVTSTGGVQPKMEGQAT